MTEFIRVQDRLFRREAIHEIDLAPHKTPGWIPQVAATVRFAGGETMGIDEDEAKALLKELGIEARVMTATESDAIRQAWYKRYASIEDD